MTDHDPHADRLPDRAGRRRAALAGARAAVSPFALVLGVSYLGIGGLAHEVGFPLAPTLVSTLLVWAAPGQAVLFAGLGAGSGPVPLALAVAVSGVRLLPLSATILPLLRRPEEAGTGPGSGRAVEFLLSHFVAVTAWLEGTRRLPGIAPEARRAWFLAFACVLVGVSITATGLGHVLNAALPPAFAAGLLLVSPLYFLTSTLAGASGRAEVAAFAVGAAAAPLAARAGAGDFDLLLAGVLGAGAGWAIDRRGAGA